MIIFNTTFHLEDEIHDEGLAFLRQTYIPSAAGSGFLLQPRLARIHRQHEEGGVSYSLQFHVKNVDVLNHWLTTDGHALQQQLAQRFGNKMLGFVTVLEEISL
ncbi:DUF4286 family protein [Dysgonomonas sp. 25]|uniref:DUF4286 family protein n=1 Tax=Dysgonomonas sp. 25 TaxID=2302933 RepID=UPI0013D42A97|nr:DUF4286 family protein [Dysgonomonas sp. 25]NDV69225.1 DUF4286 family protein [Dysgonomonas sp. 25]